MCVALLEILSPPFGFFFFSLVLLLILSSHRLYTVSSVAELFLESTAGKAVFQVAVTQVDSTTAYQEELSTMVTSVGVTRIQKLKDNEPKAKLIDLEACDLRLEGVNEVSQALLNNTVCTTLILEDNEIGLLYIFCAPSLPPSLPLSLSQNPFFTCSVRLAGMCTTRVNFFCTGSLQELLSLLFSSLLFLFSSLLFSSFFMFV